MSSVRMCDRCGTIFSEREDGWSSQTARMNQKDPDTGRMRTMDVDMDSCAACTAIMVGSDPRPSIALTQKTNPQYEQGVIE